MPDVIASEPNADSAAEAGGADDVRAAQALREQRGVGVGALLLCVAVWVGWPRLVDGFRGLPGRVEGGATAGERLALGPVIPTGALVGGGVVLLTLLLVPWRGLRWAVYITVLVLVLAAVLWGWDTVGTLMVRYMQSVSGGDASAAGR